MKRNEFMEYVITNLLMNKLVEYYLTSYLVH